MLFYLRHSSVVIHTPFFLQGFSDGHTHMAIHISRHCGRTPPHVRVQWFPHSVKTSPVDGSHVTVINQTRHISSRNNFNHNKYFTTITDITRNIQLLLLQELLLLLLLLFVILLSYHIPALLPPLRSNLPHSDALIHLPSCMTGFSGGHSHRGLQPSMHNLSCLHVRVQKLPHSFQTSPVLGSHTSSVKDAY